jgi:aminodeoxyfutalosine synthase
MYQDLIRRLAAGERLSVSDCQELYASHDLDALCAAANEVRHTRANGTAYLGLRREITYTTICGNACPVCGRAADRERLGLISRSVDEIATLAALAANEGYRHFRLVGGANPDLPYDFYLDLIVAIRALCPEAHIQAFAPAQVAQIADSGGVSLQHALGDMKRAGINSLPGDGAEVFSPRIRRVMCPAKVSGGTWLTIMREANALGITGEATMTFGHLETPSEKAEHLARLRDLQDDTGGLFAYTPLAASLPLAGPWQVLPLDADAIRREIAIARLMLDNVTHIRYAYACSDLELCRAALESGADEVCVTVSDGAAEVTTPDMSPVRDLIRSLGMSLREADGECRPLAAALS